MMKICIIKATLAVPSIAVAGYTANNIQKEEVALSEIALQNVEALARGEGSGYLIKVFMLIGIKEAVASKGVGMTNVLIRCANNFWIMTLCLVGRYEKVFLLLG